MFTNTLFRRHQRNDLDNYRALKPARYIIGHWTQLVSFEPNMQAVSEKVCMLVTVCNYLHTVMLVVCTLNRLEFHIKKISSCRIRQVGVRYQAQFKAKLF